MSTHILLVEDERIVARDISHRLERMGYSVTGVAASGEEALQKSAAAPPDVVLMDIMLQGDMDGVETCTRLKQRHDVPVIFLTAYADDQTLQRAKVTEPYGYLLKPYQERELRTAIEVAVYRHRTERKLKETQQWLSTLLRSIGDAVIATDAQGAVRLLNAQAEKLIGHPQIEVAGRDLQDVFRVMNAQTGEVALPTARALRGGRPVALPVDSVLVSRTRDIPVEGTISPIDGEQFAGFAVVFRDISEKQQADEMRRQHEEHRHANEKMASVGRLAGGLAHDFNNLLTVIMGNTSLVLSNLPASDPNHANLKDAEDAAVRAAELVRQLLLFSQQTALHLDVLDLNAETPPILEELHRARPELSIQFDGHPNLWSVRGDPLQLHQLILNLCQNAAEAMPRGGIIHIESDNVSIDEASVSVRPGNVRAGDHVRLRIRDTGPGIPADLEPFIFEPFFTTKQATANPGLGLALAYGIAERHRGWIECHGDVVPGARFDVYLPRYYLSGEIPVAAPELGRRQHAPAPHAPRRQTILVADDEPLIREFARNLLASLGYDALLAADGLEAIELFQRERDRIDLVILDLTMPRLSGCDVFWKLLEIDPAIHVLFASGYFAEDVPELEHQRVLGFISKPFRLDELANTLRAALEKIEGERQTAT
ncbi:MAG: response regulator [Gemmataceae bacterium]